MLGIPRFRRRLLLRYHDFLSRELSLLLLLLAWPTLKVVTVARVELGTLGKQGTTFEPSLATFQSRA